MSTPGSYRITENFYIPAWSHAFSFLLYLKFYISQNICEDSQYITGVFKNFYKDTNKSHSDDPEWPGTKKSLHCLKTSPKSFGFPCKQGKTKELKHVFYGTFQ